MAFDVSTASLEALQNVQGRKVLDTVDKLRRIGLQHILQLPQLVVCGDQSSGKSSVLEAITEIPFPRNENLCTRFATEIVLRRAVDDSMIAKITPDKSRPKQEQSKLESFSDTIVDFSELPRLMNKATDAMGLKHASSQPRAFTKDILQVEISGPNRPQLTVVDLPGLIHSKNKAQSEGDVSLVHSLVDQYIQNPRTIILAILSAKNDYANQIILGKARAVDDKGSRTLGIITKPDFLNEGTKNQQDWIDLALNRDIYFELGWHMLKNRADNEDVTFETRNTAEKHFFRQGAYQDRLPETSVGIEMLRERLSKLLTNHLKRELPGLQKELSAKLEEVRTLLSQLDVKRTTLSEQRQYLMRLSSSTKDIVSAATNGHYEHPIFSCVDEHVGVDMGQNLIRFRAAIQSLNMDFAKRMRLNGMTHRIRALPKESDDEDERPNQETVEDFPGAHSVDGAVDMDLDETYYQNIVDALPDGYTKILSQAEAIEWVLKILRRSRGPELAGSFNPMLIGQIFAQQSIHWKTLGEAHVKRVAAKCHKFVDLVLRQLAPNDVVSRIKTLRVTEALDRAAKASEAELSRIFEDKASHPMTYNHYFTSTLQKTRKRKYSEMIQEAVNWTPHSLSQTPFTKVMEKSINPEALLRNAESKFEPNMDKFSAQEVLESSMAYYKDELKYFIGVVTKQVIERHLIRTLPENALSPMIVATMSDEDVAQLAAEAPEISGQHSFLENRKKMLEDGVRVFKQAFGGAR